jgi:hypothetical protein
LSEFQNQGHLQTRASPYRSVLHSLPPELAASPEPFGLWVSFAEGKTGLARNLFFI